MPIKVSDLTNEKRKVRVRYNNDECEVVYRAGANSALAAIRMQDRIDSGDENQLEVLVERLAELVESWDLTDGEKPYPIQKKALLALPMPFITAVLRGIADDQNPPTRKSRR